KRSTTSACGILSGMATSAVVSRENPTFAYLRYGKVSHSRAVSLGLNWSAILFNNLRIREVEWLLHTPRPAGHAIPRRDWTAARPFSEPAIEHPEPNLATRLF